VLATIEQNQNVITFRTTYYFGQLKCGNKEKFYLWLICKSETLRRAICS